MSDQQLMSIEEASGLYVDAYLSDQSYLRFLSLWGRDTVVQEFLARLSLPRQDGGLESFWINANTPRNVQFGDLGRFEKLTGRMPKDNLFGELTHIWLYERTAVTPDYAGRRALFLFRPEEDGPQGREHLNERLWTMVRETCHLPLLSQWRDVVLAGFAERGFLSRLEGVGIAAIKITLPEQEIEKVITGWIRSGVLTIDEAPSSYPEGWFNSTEVISVYTRAQAIEDGVLVDVTETAYEAGFRCSVALTQSVYTACVAWSEDDSKRQTYQDPSGRLWDVLWMAVMAAREGGEGRKPFQLYCVPRDGESREPVLTTLHIHAGPGDDGDLVITIMLPGED